MRNADEVIPGVTLFEVKRRRGQLVAWRAYGVSTRAEFDALKVSNEDVAKMVLADKREIRVGVSVGLVRTLRGVKGTWYHFGVNTKEEFESKNISDEAIADYIIANRRMKEQGEYVEVVAGDVSGMRRKGKARGVRKTGIDLRDKWEDKMKEYHESYEMDTPNDVVGIRTLAWMDVQIEFIQKSIIELSGSSDMKTRNHVSELNKQLKDLIGESRALQKLLEIDKSSRGQKDESGIDIVGDMVKDAGWLLENEIQTVACHCEDGKVIEIAWDHHFFPTHPPRPADSDGRADKYVKGEVLW
ncbi:MAG: hypothetical protein WC822_04565 [Candidatus Paceibacterota bacterium]|jgi:hypothetical protein